MAITYKRNVIDFGAQGDAFPNRVMIQSIVLEHSAAANAVLSDAAGTEIAHLRTTASVLRDEATFPKGIWVDGITATTLSAGDLKVYIH